jgi:malonyl-CoA/methylmalonyl-CoA synthetase
MEHATTRDPPQEPMDQNLYTYFAGTFPADRTKPLLLQPGGRTWSYADVEAASARFACLLTASGLRPGDRVTVQVAKSPEAVALYLACLRGGFVFHPLNDDYRREEIAYLAGDAAPALAVCDPGREAIFRTALPAGCRLLTLAADGSGSLTAAARGAAAQFGTVARQGDDLAILLYTSGTTGRPKGAMITHGNLAANVAALVEAWGFGATDRLLHALPIYHAHGLFVGLGCTLASGASMVFLRKFEPGSVVAALPGCTVMMGVPTYYARLLQRLDFDRAACRTMRVFISGSAPLSPEVFAEFRERTGHEILERYGMTETGMNTSNPLRGERRAGSVGSALPGVSVRVVGAGDRPLPAGEVGEIQLRGPNVFPGYWRAPENTTESFTADGYFRTGDHGSLSADGYLTISGRGKDLVITGGLNVYPREVEIALDALPDVAESAVIGALHPDFGEAVVAVVVARAEAELTEAGIIAGLRDRLARFKLPKRVFVVAELPRNSMGKVEKTTLRERYARCFSTESD